MGLRVAFYKAIRPGFQGLFNRLIKWWTNGPYSHCELVLGTDDEGFSQCCSSSFIDGGVRIKEIELDPDHWDVIEISAEHAPAQVWFKHRIGRPYDVLGLIGFIWRRQDGDKKKFFCSEAVAASIGIKEPWRFDPNALAAILTSRKIREDGHG